MLDHKKMFYNLIVSVFLTIVLIAITNVPQIGQIPLFVIQVIISLMIMFINRDILKSGFVSAIRLAPNMDTLVCLGALVSFIYSVAVSVINIIYYKGSTEYIGESEMYFATCAVILTLVLVGKYLEALAKGRSSNAIRDLTDMSPKTATILVNGQ